MDGVCDGEEVSEAERGTVRDVVLLAKADGVPMLTEIDWLYNVARTRYGTLGISHTLPSPSITAPRNLAVFFGFTCTGNVVQTHKYGRGRDRRSAFLGASRSLPVVRLRRKCRDHHKSSGRPVNSVAVPVRDITHQSHWRSRGRTNARTIVHPVKPLKPITTVARELSLSVRRMAALLVPEKGNPRVANQLKPSKCCGLS